MKIRSIHPIFRATYNNAHKQQRLDAFRELYEHKVSQWQALRAEGIGDAACACLCGFSCATYYRHKKRLEELKQGKMPPARAPRQTNKPKWGQAERNLVRAVRQENPTYGKEKITVILKRDYDTILSVNTVGRIITQLLRQGVIQKSPSSASKARRSRHRFTKKAKRWSFLDFKYIQTSE